MTSLVKKTKKNVTSLNGTNIASKPVDFIAAYQKWKGAMTAVSGESIFSPNDLFKTVETHVNSSVRRGKSKNTGKDGAGVEVVGKIEKLIMEGKKIFFEKDILKMFILLALQNGNLILRELGLLLLMIQK